MQRQNRGASERPHSAFVSRRGTARPIAVLIAAAAGLLAGCVGEEEEDGGAPFGGLGGASLDLEQGQVVGALELEQVSSSLTEFVLRGTLPVPKGLYFGQNGEANPLGVIDANGNEVPAQVELVSRYPKGDHGADVVEVIARVHRKAAPAPGEHTQYKVIALKSADKIHSGAVDGANLVQGPVNVPGSVVSLLSASNQVRLIAADVFGHVYSLDVLAGKGGAVWKRYGPVTAEMRTYGTMVPDAPVGGASGTLDHMFGVHAYTSVWSEEELVGLNLRVNNGPDGATNSALDDPMGDVYFEYLYLAVPNGWTVQQAFDDPNFGSPFVSGGSTVYELVPPIATGEMHLMRENGQMHRRFMLAPVGKESRARRYLDQEGQAFCTRGSTSKGQYWSWYNNQTARYFPQSYVLPKLNHLGASWLRGKLESELDDVVDHLANGTGTGNYPFTNGLLGWMHAYGVPYGGMTGGSEIFITDGMKTAETASRAGWRHTLAVHRMATDRQANAYYAKDGDPTSVKSWLKKSSHGKYIDMIFAMSLHYSGGDPMGYDDAPTFQVDAVAAQGKQPPYETTMRSYGFIDLKHLTRYTRNAKVLAWLGNDSLAKDDLQHQAELFHLTWGPHNNNQWGGMSIEGMAEDQRYVEDIPAAGFRVGRGEGWGLDCMNAAYRLGEKSWRSEKYDWYLTAADLLLDGHSACNGFWQSNITPKNLDGKYRTRQSIEQAILENAIMGAIESVFRDRNTGRAKALEDALVKSFYGMVSPESWNPGEGAPRTIIAVGPLDEYKPPYCGTIPADGQSIYYDGFQIGNSLAYAYELTKDPFFLQKAEDWVGGSLLGTMENAGLNNIENRSGLLALAQQLN